MNAPFTMPHSLQAETAVLGVLLADNNAIDLLGDLRTEHFYRHDHRLVFEAIRTLVMQNRNADVVTVFDRLEANGKAEEVGGIVYLNDLAANAPSSRNIGRYAEIIREKSLSRGLLEAASRVQEIVTEDSGKTPVEMLDAAQAEFGKLAESNAQKGPATIQEAMTRYLDALDERFHGTAAAPGVKTGLVDLDSLLNGGLRRGALHTLGARPGMGKSALGETIACNASSSGYSTLFLSMEMPESEVTERAVANWGKVSASSLAKADKGLNWEGVTVAAAKASESMLFIDDQPGLTLLDVVTKARAIKRKYGLDLLIVDYLQLMVGSEEKRHAQIEAITKGLKILAKTLNIAVVALSQFSRDIEKRGNPRPKMSDFRDSGSIEQDSDVLFGLYREEQDNPDSQWKGVAELYILKNRQGKIGKVGLTYQGDFMRFDNFTGQLPSDDRPRQNKQKGFD